MSHLHGRRRGPERGSGASSKNPAGISGAALQRLDAVVTRRNAGFQADTPARAGNDTKNELTVQARRSASFRASIAARGANRGRAGAAERQFRAQLRISERISDFPGLFFEFPASFRRRPMSHDET
jgi:hypothetical protein